MRQGKLSWSAALLCPLSMCMYILLGEVIGSTGGDLHTFVLCENNSESLYCEEGKLLTIVNGSYGLRSANPCGATGEMIRECIANETATLNLLISLCGHKQSCDLQATDSKFQLDSCPDSTSESSQLTVKYRCQSAHDPTLTTTTSSTVPAQRLSVCVPGSRRAEGCNSYQCTESGWELLPFDRTNAACCHLWEGCASFRTFSPEEPEQPSQFGVNTQAFARHTVEAVTGWPLSVERSTTWSPDESTPLADVPIISPSDLMVATSRPGNLDTARTLYSEMFETVEPSGGVSSANSLITCPADTTMTTYWNLSWPVTRANTLKAVPCPGDLRNHPAMIRRECSAEGFWDSHVNMQTCLSPFVLTLVIQDLRAEGVANFTARLANVTSKLEQLSTGDVEEVAKFINNVTNHISTQSVQQIISITQDVFTAGSNVIGGDWRQTNLTSRTTVAMTLVTALESLALKTAESLHEDLNLTNDFISLRVKVIPLDVRSSQDLIIADGKETIEFPVSNLVQHSTGTELGRLVTVFYDNQDLWSPQEYFVVNSKVFSASIVVKRDSVTAAGTTAGTTARATRRPLEKPFTYTLHHTTNARTEKHICVYWDEEIRQWLRDGCEKVGGSDAHTECLCSHLTNFAVLLDVRGTTISPEHNLSLQIITYAGCIISIVCLALSWLTFTCIKSLSSDRNTIHKNLVVSLMLAESLFLVAMSSYAVGVPILCSVIAGILHFLFLAVFAWTCLEGVQLYIMLIEVFEAERSRTLYYYLAGYGIPAAIVGVSSAVDSTGYGTPQFCWLKIDTGFIWSFVGPVAAVMLVNLIMLGIAIYMMYKHAKMVASMKHKETSKADNIKAWIKGAVVLIVLLGLTWVFGFLYINEDTLVFAYIFTIFNSLQGLFIFIFHCVGNEKVQKEYKKYARRTSWLPNCFRVHYGGHKGLHNTTSNSSNSAGYFSKLMAKRRKSSDAGNGSLKSKRISPAAILTSHYDDSTISKEPLSTQYRISTSPVVVHHADDSAIMMAADRTPHSMC